MSRKICLVLMMVLLALSFSSCGRNADENEDEPNASQSIKIGMSFDSFVIERWTRDKEVFVSTASKLGAEVNVQNANGDIETQKEQIRYLIKKKVDAIVIIATDSDGLSDVVREAKRVGIRVIAYDRLIRNADIDLYISFDNEQVGRLMAQALKESSGSAGRYLMLCGPVTDDNVGRVQNGFLNEIEGTDIEIAGTMNADNWKAELAYDYLSENEELVKSVDCIMCGNDNIATQTVKYLAEKGLAGSIPVVGQDADLEACQRIVEGTQLMTVYKSVELLASRAAEDTVALVRDKELNDEYELIENGKSACPYVSLQPVAVYDSNMDDVIIKSGFHLASEVYLNVKEKQ